MFVINLVVVFSNLATENPVHFRVTKSLVVVLALSTSVLNVPLAKRAEFLAH